MPVRVRHADDARLRAIYREIQGMKMSVATVQPVATVLIRNEEERAAVASYLLAARRGDEHRLVRQQRATWRLVQEVHERGVLEAQQETRADARMA